MINFPLAAVSFFWTLVFWLWILVSLTMIFIILIQKGKGGGLSAAFGGGGAQSLLGTKTTDWITKFTIGLVVVFLLLAVLMSKYYRPKLSDDLKEAAPVTATSTIPAAIDSGEQAADTTAADTGSEAETTTTEEPVNNAETGGTEDK